MSRAIVLAAVSLTLWFVVSPRRRRVVARRIVDRNARASSQAIDRWEDEGGAMRPTELPPAT